ncbi:DNA-processing protein DprA [Microbacterium sp. B2969]|uniref:DNA-processing protein DprA n=1 Tax=Microbacterium alkaliflavum TaxID=3248839 RepID=A0ABW7Q5Z6_9MICO
MTGSIAFTTEMSDLLAAVAPAAAADPDARREREARVVWSHLVEPGDSVAGRLVAALGAEGALEAAVGRSRVDLGDVSLEEVEEGRRRWMPRLRRQAVHDALATAERAGIRLVVPGDAEWPSRVSDLDAHAPLALWVRGEAALLARPQPSVAIVGARAATSYGDHVAMELAADLGGSGIPIVSGAAYGIDGAAHRAALAVDAPTVALLASGADRPYPAGHADLLERIARNGAVVAESPCGAAPTKWRFLQRNRLIAALSDATVVVEAGWRSGSLNTAHHALDLGRAVGAVPGAITSAASAGCHRLLRESGAVCVTNADEVRELLDLGGLCTFGGPDDDPDPLTDDTTRVRDALSTRSWREVDDIARRAGMAPQHVEAILGLMLIMRDAEQSRLGWRRSRTT